MFKNKQTQVKLDSILKYLVGLHTAFNNFWAQYNEEHKEVSLEIKAMLSLLKDSFHERQHIRVELRDEISGLRSQVSTLTQQMFFFKRFLEGLKKENPGKILKYTKKGKTKRR